MKFAYLILAHKNPSQLARLAKTLAAENERVFVHLDAKVDIAPYDKALAGLARVSLVDERYPIYWGGMNMIRATLAMSRRALDVGADRLVLLSGLDFPIKPMDKVRAVLGQMVDHIDMIELPAPGLGYRGGLDRIEYVHAMDVVGRLGLKHRAIFFLHSKLLPWARRRPPSRLQLRMGSQWWALQASTMRAVLAAVDAYPDIERFFKWTCIPDESFFQTLVHTFAGANVSVNKTRYIVWDREPKPYVFGMEDWDALMSSKALFARKFDESVDAEVIVRLADFVTRRV